MLIFLSVNMGFPPKLSLNSTYNMIFFIFLPSPKHFLGEMHRDLQLGLDLFYYYYYFFYLQPGSVHISQDFVAPSVGHHEHFIWKYLRSKEKHFF